MFKKILVIPTRLAFEMTNDLMKINKNITRRFNNIFLKDHSKEQKITEELAAYAHRAWAGWMEYIFTKGKFNSDGSFTIDKEHTKRWLRQSNDSYDELPENEKNSDRYEADQMIKIIEED